MLDRLAGLECLAKTSGSKGLQLYVPLNTPHTHEHCSAFALAVAQVLEKHHPTRVTSVMTKTARPGKVFIDWSQNSRHKTTVAVYSLRARPHPTVSTPVTWDEVEAAADGERRSPSRPPTCSRGWPTTATSSPRPPPSNRSSPRPAADPSFWRGMCRPGPDTSPPERPVASGP